MSRLDFWVKLLNKMQLPATDWRIALFEFWALQEGMPYDKTFNPLATTRLSENTKLNTSFDIGYGAGNWNSVPVRVYASEADGVQATYETLSLSYYENIRKMLREQKPNLEIIGPKDFTSWVGDDHYGRRIYEYALTLPSPSVTIPSTTFTKEQKEEIMKMIEMFVSITYPAYWEALWNKGFTNYQNPYQPWSKDSKLHTDELAKVIGKAMNEYLNR